jgi:hypothetical protein
MKYLIAIVLLGLTQTVLSAVVPASSREPILQKVLQGFWGQAKTSDGKVIQPASDEERRTMPINMNVANFSFDMGELSGTAQWCGIDWRQSFNALMRQARRNNQTEKQLAFIAVVHGAAQELVSSSLTKSGKCSSLEQNRVRSQIE